jgi:hypothetical protein
MFNGGVKMFGLKQQLENATSQWIHGSLGSFLSLVCIVDDFGNVVVRDTPNMIFGFCEFHHDEH